MTDPKIIIFSAPSGAGKTTIVKHLLKQKNLRLEFSISATTRAPRKNEKNGQDYYFLQVDDFKKKIEQDEFLEWEEVYENQFYGTLKSEVDRIGSKGNNVIFDIDVIGGLNIKKMYGDQALSIFVKPPSMEELKKRIERRSSDTKETVEKRMSKAKYELSFNDRFDVVILNEILENALPEAENVVTSFIHDKNSYA